MYLLKFLGTDIYFWGTNMDQPFEGEPPQCQLAYLYFWQCRNRSQTYAKSRFLWFPEGCISNKPVLNPLSSPKKIIQADQMQL